jgi:hypothetical protein
LRRTTYLFIYIRIIFAGDVYKMWRAFNKALSDIIFFSKARKRAYDISKLCICVLLLLQRFDKSTDFHGTYIIIMPVNIE